jgi:hypothetical protein
MEGEKSEVYRTTTYALYTIIHRSYRKERSGALRDKEASAMWLKPTPAIRGSWVTGKPSK